MEPDILLQEIARTSARIDTTLHLLAVRARSVRRSAIGITLFVLAAGLGAMSTMALRNYRRRRLRKERMAGERPRRTTLDMRPRLHRVTTRQRVR